MIKNKRRTQKKQKRMKPKRQPEEIVTYIPKSIGIADRVQTILVYTDRFNLSPANVRANYLYRGNSAYDPDFTSTGHQPRYFDQYMAQYTHYRVLKSKITVQIVNGSGGSAVTLCVTPATNAIVPTAYEEVTELPRTRMTKLVPVSSRVTEQVTSAISTRAILGLRRNQVLDDQFSGTVSSNPSSIWYWSINAFSVNGSSNVEISITVKLEYHIDFYDRVEIPTSSYDEKTYKKKERDTLAPISNNVVITTNK